ncbi:unnamed protein product [Sphagnum balticum]
MAPETGTSIPWGGGGPGGGGVGGSRRGGVLGGLGGSIRESLSGSLRGNWGLLGGQDNPLARSSVSRREDAVDDEEALKWAALESLPTYNRVRTSVFFNAATGSTEQVDVRLLTVLERRQLLDNLLKTTEDENMQILVKMRNRMQKVGIAIPTIEVRYENLTIDADCYVGNRALPSLWNVVQNFLEGTFSTIGLLRTKKRVLTILDNVSGIIKPGRLTLLLGPPSSGKTTLLLALAGKLDKDLRVKGKITFNGHTQDEFVPEKTAAYISQNDLHVGEMTVRETLDFSAQCQGVGTRYELMEEISRREKQAGIKPEADVDAFMKATSLGGVKSSIATDYILRVLGLDICADTMVGDDLRRGISGGQKKRVTTGEMIVGPTQALFMDEISTGLDSSTTFSIVNNLRQSAKILEYTILVSLLQPAPETFNLFDDIILLSEGQVVYHGPRDQVLAFFESCGFRCPDRKGIADFLQEVTSRKDQEQYWAHRHRPYHFVPVREFAEAYQQFFIGAEMKQELAVPYPKEQSHKAALSTEKYSVTNKDLLKANFGKQWLLMKRNAIVYIFMVLQISLGAFISMTVFFRTKLHQKTVFDGTEYLGALFYAIASIMFNGFGDLAILISRLPVIIKQRDLLFYPAWSYSLATIVLNIPITLVQSVVWVSMTYYVTGYAPEASRFFKQMLLLFLVGQMSGSMFRMIGALCRTTVLANTIGFLAILICFMLGGFVIPRPSIKKWWIWGYWISPLTYAQQAIGVNEMLAPRWQTFPSGNGTKSLGVQVLESRGQFTHAYWYWLGVGALVGFIIIFNIGFTVAIALMPAVGKPQAVLSEEELAEKQANREGALVLLKSPNRSKRGSHPRRSVRRSSSLSRGGELQMQQIPSERTVSSFHRNGSDHNTTNNRSVATRGMVLPFQPLSISFNDISYFVDLPAEMKQEGITETKLRLLSNITGAFRPGVLTALVGVSGAGKTTLMDVLAGRKTGGYIEGDVRISGFPKNQKTFARISGYCEQSDIHSPQLTVRESLIFSAWLRLSSDVDSTTKMSFVEQVMDLVEMKSLEFALVGLPAISGLSTEQRKRLTIAVELVANPSIIFMDEPTSGLDARAAAIVMRTVRNTVDTGRTVVCTIHQPSIDIFEAFDELLLLKRGGCVIYMGPLGYQSHKLVQYFEAIPGVSKIKEGDNPATWMLEVSNVAVENRLGVDFAEIYEKSSLYRQNKELVKELSEPAPDTKDLSFPTEFSQPFFQQLICTLWKQHLTYWRSPDYNVVRFFFTLSTALVFGSLFWQIGTTRTTSNDLFTILGALYGATIFICFNNCGTVQPVVSIERTVFYREKAAGMYSAIPYALAQILIEIPYVLVQASLYALIVYSMVGFEWTVAKFFWFLFVLYFSLISFTFYGMMMVALTPNSQLAQIVASFFYSLFNLFSGFLIAKPLIPAWWIWYYWICPVAWTLYGLVISQFGDINEKVEVIGSTDPNPSVKDYINSYFGYKYSFLSTVAGVLVMWPVFFAIVFVFAIKYLNFQTR